MSSAYCKPLRATAAFGIALMLSSSASTALHAQAVRPAAEPSPSNDEVITMSAFTVTTQKTNDYIASETVTGTRLATLVKDLPFQVNIVTSEFIADFAAFELSEELGYTSNVSNTPDGSPILRGFKTIPYLDGFRRVNGALPANVDTDTSTVIKGPAASLYGQTSPGGIVNRTLKHPETKQKSGIRLAFGSNDTRRVNAYSTGPLGGSGKLFYRISIEDDAREYDQMYADQHKTYVSGQFLWKPTQTFEWNTRFSYSLDHNHDRNSLFGMKNSKDNVYANQNYTYYTTGTATGSRAAPFTLSVDPYRNDPADVAAYKGWVAGGFQPGFIAAKQLVTAMNPYTGLDYDSANIRGDGYLGESYNRWVNFNTSVTKHWNNFIDTKATFDYYDAGVHKQSVSGNQVYAPNPGVTNPDGTTKPNVAYNNTQGRYANGTIGTQRPQWSESPFKNIAFQIDNAISFKTGPVDHKLLVTLDYNEIDQTNYTVRFLNGARTDKPMPYPINYVAGDSSAGINLPIGFLPRGVPLTKADFWYPTYTEYPELYDTGNPQTSYDSLSRDLGLFISERASMFNNRLRGYIGIRYDKIQNKVTDYARLSPPLTDPLATPTIPLLVRWNTEAWKPQAGISGMISKNLIAFANFSTAYQPNPQYKPSRNSDNQYSAQVFPNEESWGYEFGLRFNAFKEKLNVSLSYFYIDRKSVLNSYTDEFGDTSYDSSGEQDARGVDLDFNWIVTDGLQISGGWGYNDAKYVTCGLPYLIGTPTAGAVRNNYGLAIRYSIKHGPLKGISVGGGIKYYEKSMVNPGSGYLLYNVDVYNVRMPNGALPFPNLPENTFVKAGTYPAVNVSDGRDTTYNKPYALLDYWIKYSFRTNVYGSRVSQSIQLNIKNALDRFYTYGSATVGDGRQVVVSYGITF